jgi:hypothetical protein
MKILILCLLIGSIAAINQSNMDFQEVATSRASSGCIDRLHQVIQVHQDCKKLDLSCPRLKSTQKSKIWQNWLKSQCNKTLEQKVGNDKEGKKCQRRIKQKDTNRKIYEFCAGSCQKCKPKATPAPKSTPEPKATPAPKSTPEPKATPAPKSTPEPKPTLAPTSGIDGNWGVWGEWSPCAVSCGSGYRLRNRECDSPRPQGDGKYCSHDGSKRDEMEYCAGRHNCPDEFIRSNGVCRWGIRPRETGFTWNDRYCRTRCKNDPDCTGYTIPHSISIVNTTVNNINWCNTYNYFGVTGADIFKGDENKTCYTKANSINSAPLGFVHLDGNFSTLSPKNFWTDYEYRYGKTSLGFMCDGSISQPMVIINDYDEAAEYCKNNDHCFGFTDVGCDKKGPFVICSKIAQATMFETCLIAKRERIYEDYLNTIRRSADGLSTTFGNNGFSILPSQYVKDEYALKINGKTNGIWFASSTLTNYGYPVW